MHRISLNGDWKLIARSPEGDIAELSAIVPGCALNEIVKSETGSRYKDIFWRDNANYYLKYENYSWTYIKTFKVDNVDDNAILKFERLDTYCDVYLNGNHLGYCDNGNIAHYFDVKNTLINGENTLEVYFYSPVQLTKGKKKRGAAFTFERLYTRRMQCTYGWDWTMRFVTCGIGSASIEMDKEYMKVNSAYVYTCDVDDESATVGIDIDVDKCELGGLIRVQIFDKDNKLVYSKEKYCEENFVRLYADVVSPKLWYPIGYGEQHLYKLVVFVDGDEQYSTEFGIRTVKIMQLPDEKGSDNYNKCLELKKSTFSKVYDKNENFSGFILKVNGIRIMCKGANWVPCVPFTMGTTDEKITQTLETAAKAGVNMIRVWGGGAFETEHFYNECSRLGILVTQDFLMACGDYPENEKWFIDQLKKEAEYAVLFLRNKACLMWWTGDNENAVNGCDTDKNYRGRASAYKAIAPVLYKKDFNRRFLPSSPYGGTNYASNTVGTTHNTQFLNSFWQFIEEGDYADYKNFFKQYNARFIAEETCFGAVKQSTLEKFMTKDDIFSGNDSMWKYHTQSNPGLKRELFEYLDMLTERILGKYSCAEDRYFKLKYMQYEWVRLSLERTRREKWFCSGVIYWMLNDCWPAASGWALIDYYNQPKAAYYSFKRAAKPIVLAIDLDKNTYKFHVCNDTCNDKKLKLKVYCVDADGNIAGVVSEQNVIAKSNESYCAYSINETDVDNNCFIVAELTDNNDVVDRAFYRKGILDIYRCNDCFEVLSEDAESVTIKAKSYIHALELEFDGIPENNYFSMLPGEIVKVPYKLNSEKNDIQITAYSFKA